MDKLNEKEERGDKLKELKDIPVNITLEPSKPYEKRFYYWIILQVLITLLLVFIFWAKRI